MTPLRRVPWTSFVGLPDQRVAMNCHPGSKPARGTSTKVSAAVEGRQRAPSSASRPKFPWMRCRLDRAGDAVSPRRIAEDDRASQGTGTLRRGTVSLNKALERAVSAELRTRRSPRVPVLRGAGARLPDELVDRNATSGKRETCSGRAGGNRDVASRLRRKKIMTAEGPGRRARAAAAALPPRVAATGEGAGSSKWRTKNHDRIGNLAR